MDLGLGEYLGFRLPRAGLHAQLGRVVLLVDAGVAMHVAVGRERHLADLTLKRTLACNTGKGNVLFNDALNTFYLRLYGVRYMVKDHSDRERGKPAAAT